MTDKKIDSLNFTLNKESNGGEATIISTEIYQNDTYPNDKFATQKIMQCCYGIDTVISMPMSFTPKNLREPATLLETFLIYHGMNPDA